MLVTKAVPMAHECDPPVLMVAYGDLIGWTKDVGDAWRCPSCRRRWRVIRATAGIAWYSTARRNRPMTLLGR